MQLAKVKRASEKELQALMTQFAEGRTGDACSTAKAMTKRYPSDGVVWKALGTALAMEGRLEEAIVPLRRADVLAPGDQETMLNLANAQCALGDTKASIETCSRLLKQNPNLARAHFVLGNSYRAEGSLDEAATCYCNTIVIQPAAISALNNLGVTLFDLGRTEEAVACYRRALELDKNATETYLNLAVALSALGQREDAFEAAACAIRRDDTADTRGIYCTCIKRLPVARFDDEARARFVRAFHEGWDRPNELAPTAIRLLKGAKTIRDCLEHEPGTWTTTDWGSGGSLAAVFSDPLFVALLTSTPICDIELERLLTHARSAMLDLAVNVRRDDRVSDLVLNAGMALASQCFINEYIYPYGEDEVRKIDDLRGRLETTSSGSSEASSVWLMAFAAYHPLESLPLAFTDREWDETARRTIEQQVIHPRRERQLEASIPRVTPIDSDVSVRVRQQYEANPYPRWLVQPSRTPHSLGDYLHTRFPLTYNKDLLEKSDKPIDILIAGCGTGEQAIDAARRIKGAHVLAIDLSLTSLSYAQRKTDELGIACIEYAQADLMKLGAIERAFDLIECVGVLHHLADPWTGWNVLLALLRHGGVMRLGFYSQVARRDIVTQQLTCSSDSIRSADEIRRFRQEFIAAKGNSLQDFGRLSDFFTTSSCRDLFFHVQEHRVSLSELAEFLSKNDLTFLGFDVDRDVLHAYRQRFPNDRTCTDLSRWQIFEHENPNTFVGMYQFWVQKSH